MSKKIYLASSWRNAQQPEILKLLEDEGHKVYDFRNPFEGQKGFAWSALDENWQNWSANEYRKNLLTHPSAALGFQNDMRAMQWADTCVLLLPCGRSAHLEAGWFCGMGKPCYILTKDGEETELMALMATDIVTCPIQLIDVLR
jgi:nucleoside 2-deoxyribosyltransferase